MKKTVIKIIKAYQVLMRSASYYRLPFFFYSQCKFHPTCSEFTIDAINKYGVARGLIKGAHRILKCNPTTKNFAN